MKKSDLITEFENQTDTLHWKIPMAIRADMSGAPMEIRPGEVVRFRNKHGKDIYAPYSRIVLSGKLEQYEEEIQTTIGTRPIYRKVMKTRELPTVRTTKNKDWKLSADTPGSMAVELYNEADFFVGAQYRLKDYSVMMPYGISVYLFVDANHDLAEYKKIVKQMPKYHEIIGPGGVGMIRRKIPGSDYLPIDRSQEELQVLNEIREKIAQSRVKNLKLIT
jgi:hypothetical protein